jgi:hypothetical protein
MARRQRRSAAWSRAATSERCHCWPLSPGHARAQEREHENALLTAMLTSKMKELEASIERIRELQVWSGRPQRSVPGVRRLLHGRVAPVAACFVAAYNCRVATYNCRVAARDRRGCHVCR